MTSSEPLSWRQRHRFAIHLAALLTAVIAPFLLYFALQAGLAVPAVLLFALLAAAFVAVLWVG